MEYIKAVVYDLESENFRIFENSPVKDMVRSARVRCVQLLHSLGVPCTELGLYTSIFLYYYMGVFERELEQLEKV
jgi:hypothetical protein